MGNERLVKILSDKKEWLDKNTTDAAAKSDYNKFALDKKTDATGLFLEFLMNISVPIDSEEDKLAFEELRKFANDKYSKGRWARTSNYYAELSSLISHFVNEKKIQ